jgi:GST-like protein
MDERLSGQFLKERRMIELYYWPTPNRHKITIFLEESGWAYQITPVDISAA